MRMQKLFSFILIGTLAILVAGCCPCRKYQRLYGAPLVGTQWQLIQLDGKDLPEPDSRFTLHFASRKQVDGTSGCNRFSADCEAEPDGHLHIGVIATTRMSCPEAEREAAFLKMLHATVRYELDAKMLVLSDSVGVRAIFQARESETRD